MNIANCSMSVDEGRRASQPPEAYFWKAINRTINKGHKPINQPNNKILLLLLMTSILLLLRLLLLFL